MRRTPCPISVADVSRIAGDQVKTYQLRVHVPSTYKGVGDLDLLETMYLGWVPADSIPLLAQQLKVTTSAFYTGLQSPYKDLASHVVSSFPVDSVPPDSGIDNNNEA